MLTWIKEKMKMVHSGKFWSLAMVLVAISALTACETATSLVTPTPPPVCPALKIAINSDTVTKFTEGPGRDITDIIYEAELMGISSASFCEWMDTDTGVGIKVGVMPTFVTTLGPRAAARDIHIKYFVHLVKDKKIIQGAGIPIDITFPENVSKLQYLGEEVELSIPLAADESGPEYNIYVGFQLTQDELAYNKKRNGR